MIKVVIVRDLLRASRGREIHELPDREITLRELCDLYRRLPWTPDTDLAVILNGAGPIRGPLLDQTRPKPGDQVTICPDPGGLSVVIGAAVTWLVLDVLLSTAVLMTVGAAAIGAAAGLLFGPKVKRARTEGAASPTYTWGGMATSYGAGFRIPIPFGIERVPGQVIGRDLYEVLTKVPWPKMLTSTFTDHLMLLIALGEGPIFGLGQTTDILGNKIPHFLAGPASTRKGIPHGLHINQNASWGENDSAEVRFGEIHQRPLGDWVQQRQVYAVGERLSKGRVVSYTTNGILVTDVKFRITFDYLFRVSDGKSYEYKVEFYYRFRKTGTTAWGMQQIGAISFLSRTRMIWTLQVVWPTGADADQWDFEIWRHTKDDGEDTYSTCTLTEVIEGEQQDLGYALAYPGVALLSLDIAASERLTGYSPNVTIPVYGRPVRHWDTGWQDPAFYYLSSGKWVGRNPAWILLEFLTSKRGGLGNYIADADLDLPTFIAWGAYCDELVDDGRGGTEPQCYCDLNVDSGESAWDGILQILRTGNAVPYFAGNKFSIKWAYQRTPVQVFSEASMSGTRFTFIDTRTRPNVIDVQILNEDNDWEQDIISVEDPDALGIFDPFELGAEPIRRQTIEAYGITRESQARRLAAWHHAVNKFQYYLVEWDCQVDALAAEMADVVGIQTSIVEFFTTPTDSYRALEAGSATTAIKLDKDIEFAAASYELLIVSDDGTVATRGFDGPGDYPAGSPITFTGGALSFAISAPVAIGRATGKTVEHVEILEITINEDLTRHVKAIKYDDAVYGAIDPKVWAKPWPTIAVQRFGYLDGTQGEHLGSRTGLDGEILFWTPPPGYEGRKARLYVRETGEPTWERAWSGVGTQAEIHSLEPWKTYEAFVSIDGLAGPGPAPNDDGATEIVPEEFPRIAPTPPQDLEAVVRDDGVLLSWRPGAGEIDHYEIREGDQWIGANVMATTKGTSLLISSFYGPGFFRVRSVSRRGLISGIEQTASASRAYPAGTTEVFSNDLIPP